MDRFQADAFYLQKAMNAHYARLHGSGPLSDSDRGMQEAIKAQAQKIRDSNLVAPKYDVSNDSGVLIVIKQILNDLEDTNMILIGAGL